jgi:hypothetical protein
VGINYDVDPLPVLRAAPPALQRGHPAVLLGNVKFFDVKNVLNKHGFTAELINQVLVVNNGTRTSLSSSSSLPSS